MVYVKIIREIGQNTKGTGNSRLHGYSLNTDNLRELYLSFNSIWLPNWREAGRKNTTARVVVFCDFLHSTTEEV